MVPTILTLKSGSLILELCPPIGGAIVNLRVDDAGRRSPVMRESGASLANVLDAACFPLVPFVNRVRGGAFTFRGRSIQMSPNLAGDPSPLHGQGWLNPWTVDGATETAAFLSFHHRPGEWPWEYEAHQSFSLDEGGLTLGLTCRNLDPQPMPCGLGQHPYFPCGAETRITMDVTHVWTIDEHVLPVEKIPAAGRFDLHDRLACGQDLDHGFGGWGGTARLTDPSWRHEVQISSSDARFFQVYSPSSGGFFVAEPVGHANAALNEPEEKWPELGLRVLETGEEIRFDVRIDVISGS